MGPGAPAPQELVEGFVLLCHTTYVTLLEGQAIAPLAHQSGQHRGGPEPWMFDGLVDVGASSVACRAASSGRGQAVARFKLLSIRTSGLC